MENWASRPSSATGMVKELWLPSKPLLPAFPDSHGRKPTKAIFGTKATATAIIRSDFCDVDAMIHVKQLFSCVCGTLNSKNGHLKQN